MNLRTFNDIVVDVDSILWVGNKDNDEECYVIIFKHTDEFAIRISPETYKEILEHYKKFKGAVIFPDPKAIGDSLEC